MFIMCILFIMGVIFITIILTRITLAPLLAAFVQRLERLLNPHCRRISRREMRMQVRAPERWCGSQKTRIDKDRQGEIGVDWRILWGLAASYFPIRDINLVQSKWSKLPWIRKYSNGDGDSYSSGKTDQLRKTCATTHGEAYRWSSWLVEAIDFDSWLKVDPNIRWSQYLHQHGKGNHQIISNNSVLHRQTLELPKSTYL